MAVQSKTWSWKRSQPTSDEPETHARVDNLAGRLAATVRTAGAWRIAFAVFVSLNIALNLVWLVTTRSGLKDLGSFLHSGAGYRHGLNPYTYESWLLPQPISVQALNLNPPISVYGFDYLSRMPQRQVEAFFMGGSILMLAVAVGLLMWTYRDKRNLLVLLSVLSFAGVWHMLWYLQLYAPLVLAVTVSWLLMRRGNLLWAGVLLGLVVAIKPNFGVVILALLAARHYRVALPALGTAAAVSIVPILITGPQIYQQWLDLIASFNGLVWTSNASIVSAGARLHMPALGYVLAAITLAGVLYWQWRFKPPVMQSCAAAIAASILIGPVSWAGYTLFLLPYLFSKQWDRRLWLAVVMLDMPFAPKLLAEMLGFHIPNAPAASLNMVTAITASVYVWAMVLLTHHTLTSDIVNRESSEAIELREPQPVLARA